MNQSHPHGEDGDLVTLTEKDRARIQEEINDLDASMLRCRDTGLWSELARVRRHLADELAAGRRLPLGEDAGIWYDYEITPLTSGPGIAGWKLRLLQDGVEVGGDVVAVVIEAESFLPWWKSHTEEERTRWLMRTATSLAVEAYLIHLLDEAWHRATRMAGEWLDSRPQEGAARDPS
jgi:hypothetical protein